MWYTNATSTASTDYTVRYSTSDGYSFSWLFKNGEGILFIGDTDKEDPAIETEEIMNLLEVEK